MKRGNFLEHVGWTGAGIVFTVSNLGVVRSAAEARTGDASFSFVQISDSHIGFKQAANDHVADTLAATVVAINALPEQPAFVMHTGDVTHLAKPAQFDAAKSILSDLKAPLFSIPRRTRRHRRRGQSLFRSVRQEGTGRGLVFVRPARHALRGAGQRL